MSFWQLFHPASEQPECLKISDFFEDELPKILCVRKKLCKLPDTTILIWLRTSENSVKQGPLFLPIIDNWKK